MPSKTTVSPAIQPGEEIALGHTAAQAAEYRQLTEQARHQQGSHMPPPGAQAVQAAPAGTAAVLSARDARDLANRAWSRLQAKAEGIERELSRPAFGMAGQPVPHLVAQQAAARQELEATRAAMAEIEAILDDGQALIAYAAAHPAAQRARGEYVS